MSANQIDRYYYDGYGCLHRSADGIWCRFEDVGKFISKKDEEIEELKAQLNCAINGNGFSIRTYKETTIALKEAIKLLKEAARMMHLHGYIVVPSEIESFIKKYENTIKE